MSFLSQLLGLGKKSPAQRPQLMQVSPTGGSMPSNQGHLPPAQQQDTWMSDDPTAMTPPQRPMNISAPRMMYNPQIGQSAQLGYQDPSSGDLVQGGSYNPGFIPIQGTQYNMRRPLHIQNGNDQRIQY